MNRSFYNSPTGLGFYEEDSIRTTDFHNLVRSGARLPMNPYRWRRFDASTPLSLTYNGLTSDSGYTRGFYRATVLDGYENSGYYTNGPSMSSVTSIATNNVLDKVRNTEIDLGVTLGEYKETAEFFTNAVNKTVNSYRSFRRGDVSAALRHLTGRRNSDWRDIPGVAANSWLAYTYGLRPLIKDVNEVYDRLHRGYQGQPGVVKVRSTHKETVDVVNNQQDSAFNGQISEWHGQISASAEVGFTVSNPFIRQLDQVGVLNPVSVAWELVPFSFVVDQVYPIGDALMNLLPPQGVDFVEGWVSQKSIGSSTHRTDFANPSPGWHTVCQTVEVYKNRYLLTDFPAYKVIKPDFRSSAEKIATGLALLFSISKWGKENRVVRPEPLNRGPRSEKVWRDQWPSDPWWSL